MKLNFVVKNKGKMMEINGAASSFGRQAELLIVFRPLRQQSETAKSVKICSRLLIFCL